MNVLSQERLDAILARIPNLTIGVIGDLFLDRYLDIDPDLTEPSLETGLDAYQVVRVRSQPGAAGTVINNLHALGVGRICVVSVIGEDGEGFELRQALARMQSVHTPGLLSCTERRTPTYMKPMLGRDRELSRLDIKNREPFPRAIEQKVIRHVARFWDDVDALLVLDQVSEVNCGVVTDAVRDELATLGEKQPDRMILADSRERIGQFGSVWLKPNHAECGRAVLETESTGEWRACTRELARRVGRPVFCTCAADGIMVVDGRSTSDEGTIVPAAPVSGPIDPVGAGDSCSAALACAAAAGATLVEAAAFANIVASITIQQLGTTGTATPQMIRKAIQT